MALRSGLALVIYTAYTTARPLIVAEYTRELDSLSFTTLSPGGYGQLTARLNTSRFKRWSPEFDLFSRVALVAGGAAIWLGETVNPTYGMDANGEYVLVNALGAGNSLRDDPLTLAYVAQTPKQVVTDQLTRRAAYLPIDQDATGIFPNNPSTLLSPVYQERTMEDVVNDVVQLTGDYAWGVWGHAINRDVAGFPTAQLLIHSRDTSTLSYVASMTQGDIVGYRSTPAAERAYNVTQVDYLDPTSGATGTQVYTDSRLNADGSQGSAPFRRRKYVKNLRGLATATATDAARIATTYGPQMKNPSSKTTLTLGTVRDPNMQAIPLWSVQADTNIAVPEWFAQAESVASLAAPAAPSGVQTGVSQFYIVQSTYTEDRSRYSLEVQCDNYADRGEILVARLQEQADEKTRQGQQTTGIVQAQGAAMRGYYSWRFSNAIAGDNTGAGVQFPAIAIATPTSLTITPTASNNIAGVSANNFSTIGASLFAAASANGSGYAIGTYQTNGNCLLHVDGEGRRLTKHCDGCNQVSRDLGIEQHARVDLSHGATPRLSALAVTCPVCGTVEAFDTGLGEAEEAHAWEWRAGQARLIRTLMRALGMTLA